MKKVLIAFDGGNFSEGAFAFALKMNSTQPLLLTGVFLHQLDYANLWTYANAATPVFVPLVEADESVLIERNVARFESSCKRAKIDYKVHTNVSDFALPELKNETRYTDLLIVGSETFYSNMSKAEVNLYLQDALHEAECPVIVVPEEYAYPNSNILAYDGTASSVFAIKQFTYLFPEFTRNPTSLTYATRDYSGAFPEHEKMQELVAGHFTDLNLLNLELDLKKYFAVWMSEKKAAILVCGSFGRSGLSRMLKSSFIADVIADHKIPVFIAHR
ncbi:adenine nucleotide alpha hydrolase family protein [Flavitalea antarctica]